MALSAIFLAIAGLITSYFPEKVLETHGVVPNSTMLGVLIGGIYARPVALGNFLHFAMVGVMLVKAAIVHEVIQLATSGFVFSAFAIWFGIVLFRPPVAKPAQHNKS
jgi:hypothetical protein